ncbi:MAG: acyl-phosphate glycerol 3-phosphate acyltransferase [Omnitrophica bacterium RIFCSPHIGHO2_02_FULL_46_11]|nr:MAG: acyl-phosphate glycerol 3-phosphate acyltransferase [Omnitrophica bacterium RIFCSPLOWO2_01_FULL_45_10b]OGW86013.1 MAG: acyl-phosphate glycerol 3-phosphate acyltransferase [Omnitrophica bacterium RIFCSPHIGHO2_02_FULL_46_11]
MNLIQNLVWLIIAYLIGSTPTAYLIAKRVRGIDIREHGSGNVGATNVFRVVGKKWGFTVLAIDIFKGWIVTAILTPISGAFPELSLNLCQLLFGVAAIAGHSWTPWLGLKGGKGIATSAGALLGILPFATLAAFLIWGVCFLIWRYVSLASIVAAASFPILLLIFYSSMSSFPLIFAISLALAALLIYNHTANIKRLKRGEEPRVHFGKSKNSAS